MSNEKVIICEENDCNSRPDFPTQIMKNARGGESRGLRGWFWNFCLRNFSRTNNEKYSGCGENRDRGLNLELFVRKNFAFGVVSRAGLKMGCALNFGTLDTLDAISGAKIDIYVVDAKVQHPQPPLPSSSQLARIYFFFFFVVGSSNYAIIVFYALAEPMSINWISAKLKAISFNDRHFHS